MNKNEILKIVNTYLTESVKTVFSKYCWFDNANSENYNAEEVSKICESIERPEIISADVWISSKISNGMKLFEVEINIKTESIVAVYAKFKNE